VTDIPPPVSHDPAPEDLELRAFVEHIKAHLDRGLALAEAADGAEKRSPERRDFLRQALSEFADVMNHAEDVGEELMGAYFAEGGEPPEGSETD
jgi:hypothetical protein